MGAELESGDSVDRGIFQGEKEKGAAPQAGDLPRLSSDPRKGLPFLSTQLFHFRKNVSWMGQAGWPLQPPSEQHSLPSRRPSLAHSPVFGSLHLLMKDSRNWPSWKAQGTLRQQDRKNSGSEDKVLDLRYGHRVS